VVDRQRGLKVATGLVKKREVFYYNPDAKSALNPHTLIVGQSGSGKSTLLRKIIEYYYENDKTVFIIDFHGDLKTDNENLLEFTPRNSPNGINPFEIEQNKKNGGPNEQANVIALMMGAYFMDRMSQKQKGIIEQLVKDTYISKGIKDELPETWTKEPPTMKDLYATCVYIENVLNGGNALDSSNISKANSLIEDALSKIEKAIDSSEDENEKRVVAEIKDEISELNDKLKAYETAEGEARNIYADLNIENYVRVKKSLESVFAYIKDASNMSIFDDTKPKLIKGINRLDFSAFTAINKPLIAKFLAEFIAQKLFRSSMMRGEFENLENVGDIKYDRVLIIDESKLALPQGREKDNPYHVMNRITTESRKYGMAVCIVSQRLEHYTKDMLSNIYTKIILKVNATDYKSVAQTLGIDLQQVKNTFESQKGRTAIIETAGTEKLSYLIEEF